MLTGSDMQIGPGQKAHEECRVERNQTARSVDIAMFSYGVSSTDDRGRADGNDPHHSRVGHCLCRTVGSRRRPWANHHLGHAGSVCGGLPLLKGTSHQNVLQDFVPDPGTIRPYARCREGVGQTEW